MIKDAKILVGAAALAAILVAGPVAAERKAGDMVGRIGLTNVDPDSDNGNIKSGVPVLGGAAINVDDDTSVGVTGLYTITDNIGVELLAATPFQHDISVGGTQIGSTDHLPPTLSAQWHFNSDGDVHPYVGLGLNYTNFFSEESNDVAVQGLGTISDIRLDDSWGVAVQAGVDFEVTERVLINFDVRWIDIDSTVDVKVDGIGWVNSVATAEIDPVVISLMAGYKF